MDLKTIVMSNTFCSDAGRYMSSKNTTLSEKSPAQKQAD